MADRCGEKTTEPRKKAGPTDQDSQDGGRRLEIATQIRRRNREQGKWPKQSPAKMTRPPKLERADCGHQNVQHQRRRPNDDWSKSKQRHRCDIT